MFGEEKGYFIVIDGDKIKFFNEEQQIVDSLLLRLADKSPEPESRNLDP